MSLLPLTGRSFVGSIYACEPRRWDLGLYSGTHQKSRLRPGQQRGIGTSHAILVALKRKVRVSHFLAAMTASQPVRAPRTQDRPWAIKAIYRRAHGPGPLTAQVPG